MFLEFGNWYFLVLVVVFVVCFVLFVMFLLYLIELNVWLFIVVIEIEIVNSFCRNVLWLIYCVVFV